MERGGRGDLPNPPSICVYVYICMYIHIYIYSPQMCPEEQGAHLKIARFFPLDKTTMPKLTLSS